ncbi:MAG: hypothetical protein O6700_02785 [Gammaproteobacteria bacterium]|nr:hypothetical protein [Gammaproteobacteria bacterium]
MSVIATANARLMPATDADVTTLAFFVKAVDALDRAFMISSFPNTAIAFRSLTQDLWFPNIPAASGG